MDRVAFSLWGIEIMWYGILIAIGMMLAVFISTREAKRVGYDENYIMDLCLFMIPIGIIGARAYYVLFSWQEYAGDLSQVFNIRGGGLAIHGGIIAGLTTAFIYSKVRKLDFFKLMDIVVLGLPLAQSIGRWGNFINKEAHGGPTDLPWGIMVDGQRVHPTFLYESVWNFALFLLLMKLRKNKKYQGELMSVYLMVYSFGRFFIEGMRTDSLMFGPIRMAQFISLVGIGIGLCLHFILKKRCKDGI